MMQDVSNTDFELTPDPLVRSSARQGEALSQPGWAKDAENAAVKSTPTIDRFDIRTESRIAAHFSPCSYRNARLIEFRARIVRMRAGS